MGSRYFSDRRLKAALLVLGLVLPACVTVNPQDKEFLANPAMTFGTSGKSQAQEDHVHANREGSVGAGTAIGGGCGCN